MKRISYFLLVSVVASLMACNDDTPENPIPDDDQEITDPEKPIPDDKDDNDIPEVTLTDLSKDELANCYIVQEPGKYMFKADNQFNLGAGLPVPPVISPVSAGLIWQTEPGSLSEVELVTIEDKPFVSFTVNKAYGNAVIAVYDDASEIVWSWHIWMPEDNIEALATSDGYEVMNMNLGALTEEPGDPASYGMLYQWGRKDPFPASATLTGDTSTISAPMYDMDGNEVRISNSDWTSVEDNTVLYSISHPTVCLSNYAHSSETKDWLKQSDSDDSLWGNPQGDLKDEENNYINNGAKTCYDPSPAGWRVASPDVFCHFTSTGGYTWEFVDFNIKDINNDHILDSEDYNYGWVFYLSEDNTSYFPAASRFDGSYAMLMGSMSGLWGNYWSNSASSRMTGGAICALAFQIKDMSGNESIAISPAGVASRADAYSVRCIRDNR